MPELEHGTRAGYERHKRRGEYSCEACRTANTKYAKAYRQGSGKDSYQRSVVTQGCRAKAMRALARQYPGELRDLYRRERAAAGLL